MSTATWWIRVCTERLCNHPSVNETVGDVIMTVGGNKLPIKSVVVIWTPAVIVWVLSRLSQRQFFFSFFCKRTMRQEDNYFVDNEEEERPSTDWYTLALLIVTIWSLLGVLAFWWSLICFGLEGSYQDKWIGLLVSIVMGPFYWLYYSFAPVDYCSMSSSPSQQRRQTQKFTKINKKPMTKKSPKTSK